MKRNIYLLIILCIIVVLLVILNNKEYFQDTNNGYTKACNEINTKRLFLKSYIQRLRNPVQDLSGSMTKGIYQKKENMNFQTQFTDRCISKLDTGCKRLATVDSYMFQVLPSMDIFYQNLLLGGYNIDSLLQQLNSYSEMLKCPNVSGSNATKDLLDSEFDVSRDLGDIDTATLGYELEKLSPYYLSPDVVEFLLKFLISQEQLNNLNFTSSDYVNQEKTNMKKIRCLYTGLPSDCN